MTSLVDPRSDAAIIKTPNKIHTDFFVAIVGSSLSVLKVNGFYKEKIIQETQRKKAPKGYSNPNGAFILEPSGKPIS